MLLFDEIEKAHPDVFNIMLQILDDGQLTDGKGKTVDFKNTLVIMTSNIGSQHILHYKHGESDYNDMQAQVMSELQAHFRPEFLNRVDESIVFHALGKEDLRNILHIQLKRLGQRLADRKLTLQLNPSAEDYLIETGYSPTFGARPLKRVIQKEVENPLSMAILQGRFLEGDAIVAEHTADGMLFSKPDAVVPAM